ncbi:hypothetical protein [Runella sp.]|jgi:hypothetical protein|uniref:hypothetical protein n=1 Tax=Runella sp. TaxID=1960881 RepID=UPI00260E3A72|nr:hypothetical protein [Runella sp.]
MEQYTNAYYDNYHTATTEAERSRIKAEFEAVFAVLTENQRREVKAILMKRIDERMAKLAPLDEAIKRFNDYLKQRDKQVETVVKMQKAA